MPDKDSSEALGARLLGLRSSEGPPDKVQEAGLAHARKLTPAPEQMEPTWGGGYKTPLVETRAPDGLVPGEHTRLVSIEGKIDKLITMLTDAVKQSRSLVRTISADSEDQ